MGPDQTQHMFIYPALALLYPPCHFARRSLRAIRRGSRSRNLWQRLFLIHKSQKDQFKIHEQSVLLQLVVSVTVGQWRQRGKFCLHSFYRETQALAGESRRYNRSVPGIFNHVATEEIRVNNKYSMKLENKGGSLVWLRVWNRAHFYWKLFIKTYCWLLKYMNKTLS